MKPASGTTEVSVASNPHPGSWRSLLGWFAMGVAVALYIMFTQAITVGGWTGLLAVGEDSGLLPAISDQLDDLVVVEGDGNDGQIYYAIANDLSGETAPQHLNLAGLRYRRILYPALASWFGILEGEPVFWNMVALSLLGIGLASAALASIATHLGLRKWVMLALLANPGVWLGLHILVPDPLSIGLALTAIALMLRHHHRWAIACLALAALSKEPFLVVAFSLAGWLWFQRERTRAILYATIPAIPLGIWTLIVNARIGGGTSTTGISPIPFRGMVQASDWWSQVPTREFVGTVLTITLIAIGLGAVFTKSSHWVRWCLWPWLALLVFGSIDIWRFGLGTLRIAAPVGIFAGIAIAEHVRNRLRPAGVKAI